MTLVQDEQVVEGIGGCWCKRAAACASMDAYRKQLSQRGATPKPCLL